MDLLRGNDIRDDIDHLDNTYLNPKIQKLKQCSIKTFYMMNWRISYCNVFFLLIFWTLVGFSFKWYESNKLFDFNSSKSWGENFLLNAHIKKYLFWKFSLS